MAEGIARDTLERLCVCPITMRRMRDPVVDPMGFTYERAAFNEALARRPGVCPLTNEPYAPLAREEDDLFRALSAVKLAVPNRLVRDFIQELGDTGTIDLARREERLVPVAETSRLPLDPTWSTAWHDWLPLREASAVQGRDRETLDASETTCDSPRDGCIRFLAVVGCMSPFMILTIVVCFILS
ncbi:hypothetical protein CYMTET_11467 [Cymbomonas tetramitiformis]|uniref:U-box domain-containing protein n=1 Tax=Cymbomonas tetramitiformis TaxID=36881 RepID=A0AAE0BAZ2_9CHLO|nr:hypothetical protein CYMTET_57062 [Cymbomonas tetramitiformis]KAK3280713.1 hypothetical protein CYMTET_11467 [Cymbomonas tetramitiformis]